MDGATIHHRRELTLVPHSAEPRSDPSSAHLIGIAGSGMQSLATVLLERGWQVSGSDLNPQAAAELGRYGAKIHTGHTAQNVPATFQWAIHSDAIPSDNVERRRAVELGIRSASYPAMLAELSRGSTKLAVAGTHGKSTTTAMAAAAMVRAGLDPTVICGAMLIGCRTGGRSGRSSLFLVEACEFRENFLHLRPHVAVVLGIEPDHFDYYRSEKHLIDAFRRFVSQVPTDGLALVNRDCRASRGAGPPLELSDGDIRSATRRGLDGRPSANLPRPLSLLAASNGHPVAEVALQVAGRHNVSNALAAAALATAAGADPDTIAAALSSFRGLKRRLEVIGQRGGVTLIDDYAHHPTEIRATLTTVRQMYPGRRIWCVFQPHQASRTAALLDELAASLHNADKVAVAEIFRAREPSHRQGDVTAADLAAAVAAAGGDVIEEHDLDGIVGAVAQDLRPGDILITMGAGDIGKIGQAFYQRLRKDRARS